MQCPNGSQRLGLSFGVLLDCQHLISTLPKPACRPMFDHSQGVH